MPTIPEIIENCKKSPFFGERGLTSTSANHIANKAKEMFLAIEQDNKNFVFLNVKYKVIDKEEYIVTGNANEKTFEKIKSNLKKVGKLKALIAWLREAIKLKSDTIRDISQYGSSLYSNDFNKPNLIPPREIYVYEDMARKAIFDIDKQQRYLELEAQAANLGSFIHRNGTLNEARKKYNELRERTLVQGQGTETTFITYIPTITPELMETSFMELQEMQRSVQAELNGMKNAVEMKLLELQNEYKSKYRKELAEYTEAQNKLEQEVDDFRKKASQEIAALKIIIPENLKSIYEEVDKG